MKKIIFILSFLSFIFSGCEDVIEIKLKEGQSQLCVDGWITNEAGKQTIKLRKTINYFDNTQLPGATGATVTVTDGLGRTFNFIDNNSNGNYEWSPSLNDTLPLGIEGNVYKLKIEYEGETFTATSLLNRTPPIDSLFYTYREPSGNLSSGGYLLDMKAIDLVGDNDLYWFKVWRNDTLLNKPSNINVAYDASFGGPGADGIQFIPPIIFGLTPDPYRLGDTVVVKIYSIDFPTYNFLFEAQVQMTNSGLFATPASNVHYNIYNADTTSKTKAVGWFGASSVSQKGVRIK